MKLHEYTNKYGYTKALQILGENQLASEYEEFQNLRAKYSILQNIPNEGKEKILGGLSIERKAFEIIFKNANFEVDI